MSKSEKSFCVPAALLPEDFDQRGSTHVWLVGADDRGDQNAWITVDPQRDIRLEIETRADFGRLSVKTVQLSDNRLARLIRKRHGGMLIAASCLKEVPWLDRLLEAHKVNRTDPDTGRDTGYMPEVPGGGFELLVACYHFDMAADTALTGIVGRPFDAVFAGRGKIVVVAYYFNEKPETNLGRAKTIKWPPFVAGVDVRAADDFSL